MNTIMKLSSLCCLALCFIAIAAEAAEKPELTALRQDSNINYSQMNFSLFSSLYNLGILNGGMAVKFSAPKAGWKLQAVRAVGWSGYNESTQSYPGDGVFLLEVRDSDMNLLYKFADVQNNYFLSESGPVLGEIEIPAVAVTGDFYVILYDRGTARIGMENNNGTGNSFIYLGGDLVPAERVDPKTNETIGVNWMIEAAGN
ncbi:MAG TPA: hypothetical protein PKK11_01150 [Methanothrix sp.]|nr:hypothetical protein [Methanothrix sp.]HPT18430.1 hypothetical protein [Methanothrix sp.]